MYTYFNKIILNPKRNQILWWTEDFMETSKKIYYTKWFNKPSRDILQHLIPLLIVSTSYEGWLEIMCRSLASVLLGSITLLAILLFPDDLSLLIPSFTLPAADVLLQWDLCFHFTHWENGTNQNHFSIFFCINLLRMCMCVSEDNLGELSLSSTMWVLVIELWLSGLAASGFLSRSGLQALVYVLIFLQFHTHYCLRCCVGFLLWAG